MKWWKLALGVMLLGTVAFLLAGRADIAQSRRTRRR
jgi:hypothetical protein